ncbi:MAG: hypothetical protein NVS1B4_03910 [Gemmatimonadaceae bacterium]
MPVGGVRVAVTDMRVPVADVRVAVTDVRVSVAEVRVPVTNARVSVWIVRRRGPKARGRRCPVETGVPQRTLPAPDWPDRNHSQAASGCRLLTRAGRAVCHGPPPGQGPHGLYGTYSAFYDM